MPLRLCKQTTAELGPLTVKMQALCAHMQTDTQMQTYLETEQRQHVHIYLLT